MVRCEHLGDLHHGTIQQMTILSCCVLPSYETNTATIQTVDVDGVTSKLVLHHHAQLETKTDTAILPIENQRVPTPKLMQLAVAPVVAFKKANKNNALHNMLSSQFVFCVRCVACSDVSFAANRHNSTTSRTYGALYISACCWHQGETIYVVSNGFREG